MSNPVFLYKIKPLRREMIANEQVAITFDYSALTDMLGLTYQRGRAVQKSQCKQPLETSSK